MFTANDIRETGFSKAGLTGYKAADVDEFKELVAKNYEALENSNRDLVEKIKVLAAHIEKLQENEESVKTCMINAQIAADKVVRDADNKAKDMILKAEESASELIQEAHKKADYIFEETKKKSEEFLVAAKEKSDSIIAQAENDAIVLRNETDKKINVQKQVYERLKKEILSFRDASIESCKQQLEILNNVSDSELILDSIANEDISNDDFNEKIADETFVPEKSVQIDFEDEEEQLLDEIEEEEIDESQGTFFQYQQ